MRSMLQGYVKLLLNLGYKCKNPTGGELEFSKAVGTFRKRTREEVIQFNREYIVFPLDVYYPFMHIPKYVKEGN